MSATLTHTPETQTPVSDRTPAPRKNAGWVIAAATAAVAVIVAVGFAVTDNNTDDGSHQFAETQRQTAFASAQTDVSSGTAEFQRQLALAPVDASTQQAETQRMTALAPKADTSVQLAEDLRFAAVGAGVDTSVHFAETQRFLAVQAPVDTNHDVAECERMQALDDTSWEEAEARRFATLDPSDN